MHLRKFPARFQLSVFTSLIRALFPSWNFFDRIAYSFHLEFKIPGALSWQMLSFAQDRRELGLFLNHSVNTALAQINIIEHFAQDIQELQSQNPLLHSKDVQRLTSYKLLLSVIQERLQYFEVSEKSIQFKVTAYNSKEEIDLYISDWLSWGKS